MSPQPIAAGTSLTDCRRMRWLASWPLPRVGLMVQVSGVTSASAVSSAISAPSCRRAYESFDRAHCRPLGIQPNAMPRLGGQDDIRKYQRRSVEVTANCAEMKGSLRKVAEKHKAEKRQRRQSEMIALNVLCQTDGNVAACQRYLTLRLGAHRPTVP